MQADRWGMRKQAWRLEQRAHVHTGAAIGSDGGSVSWPSHTGLNLSQLFRRCVTARPSVVGFLSVELVPVALLSPTERLLSLGLLAAITNHTQEMPWPVALILTKV